MNGALIKKIVQVSLTAVELTGVLALTGIALKRNDDCYKAQCESVDLEAQLFQEQLKGILKDRRIMELENELEELKSKKKFKFKFKKDKESV